MLVKKVFKSKKKDANGKKDVNGKKLYHKTTFIKDFSVEISQLYLS